MTDQLGGEVNSKSRLGEKRRTSSSECLLRLAPRKRISPELVGGLRAGRLLI